MSGQGGRGRVLLIDGRSGSGKTELARGLGQAWPAAQLLRLDNLYPGWGGLEQGSLHVTENVLSSPRPRWQRWDWATESAAEWHELDPARPLIIEGCGALSGANRSLADFALWVELDEPTRRGRAHERDGGAFDPFWQQWAEQEDAFIARERPEELADEIVDGTDVYAGIERWAQLLGGRAD